MQPWIVRAPHAPYFTTDQGQDWAPIGQNDSITWFELSGLQDRRDLPDTLRHLNWLRSQGVTVLRLMLEYAETGRHFWDDPAGHVQPHMIQLWDDLFDLARRAGLRILLTPMDTFFHYVRWDIHPWNQANGGPCPDRTHLMTHPAVRALIKQRLAFATGRWGADGTIFAWDLWNEMHPVQGEDHPTCVPDYIADVGPWLRDLETRLHGRAHLQTVSIFGPELHWKPWLNEPVFRHPALDFANNHFYAEGSIDHPRDTVAPALATAALVREALSEIIDQRPFFDTEHGPIHTFKDHRITLPEPFDDEYFRHMQWAHLAAGGAGGGMRWPNRHPHRLTLGMRREQHALATFLPLIGWSRFDRRPLDLPPQDGLAIIACADPHQALVFLLRTTVLEHGQVDPTPRPGIQLTLPLAATATFYDPLTAQVLGAAPTPTFTTPEFGPCLAIAVRSDESLGEGPGRARPPA